MTNLIIISSENDVKNEISIIERLFEDGLELFHLRKPAWSEKDQDRFFSQINPVFHSRISVHQNRESVKKWKLKYCHFKSGERNFLSEKKEEIHYSTSFHSLKEMEENQNHWHYCFIGPLFKSISKINYAGSLPENILLPSDKKVFALGGITAENAVTAFQKGFSGVAALGFIWEHSEKASEHFAELKKTCRQNVHTH